MSRARGFTAIELMVYLGVASVMAALTMTAVLATLEAQRVKDTVQNADSVLSALERAYFAYCDDPSSAPSITGSMLVNEGFLPSAQYLRTGVSSSAMSVSINFTAPTRVSVVITAKSAAKASAVARQFGKTATVAGPNVTLTKLPQLYDMNMSSSRNTFTQLFHTSSCSL